MSKSSLSRRSSPISSSPATGSSCEVGSSSTTSAGRPASAAPSATRCSSPPGQLAGRRGRAAAAIPSASAASSTPRATAARRLAPVLERERELGANRPHHDLGLGVLEQRPDPRRELARAVLAGVHPGDRDPARQRRRRGSAARARSPPAAASTCPSPMPRRRSTSSPGLRFRLTSRSAGSRPPGYV